MRCIFCLEEKCESEEHVFPLGIGGCLTSSRVCGSCNSKIGSSIDAPLIDHSLIILRRATLGIAGRGDVPNAFEHLFGNVVLASDPSRRLRITIDSLTGKLDIYAFPNASVQQLIDGTTVKRLVLDARDIDKLGVIITKIRERQNLPPLPPEEIARIVLDAQQNINTIDNPEVLTFLKCDLYRFMRGILKICYELAFLWFGEEYLEDSIACTVRGYLKAIVNGGLDADELPMKGTITTDIIKPMEMWSLNTTLHIAFATVVNNQIAICLKIFDVFYAVLVITENAKRYISGAMSDRKLRFLVIDPVTRVKEETALMDEFGRIAGIITGRVSAP